MLLELKFDCIDVHRCRAPIASLDCMEEFSTGSALSALGDRGGDGGITKEQLLLSGLTHSAPSQPLQLARQTSITPGLRYRNLGKSGLRVSNIGLGTWPTFGPSVTEEQAEQIIVLAVDSGINVFDLSEAHSGKRSPMLKNRDVNYITQLFVLLTIDSLYIAIFTHFAVFRLTYFT